jgi:hypothetical protein
MKTNFLSTHTFHCDEYDAALCMRSSDSESQISCMHNVYGTQMYKMKLQLESLDAVSHLENSDSVTRLISANMFTITTQ